jgi:hypothetical protein
MFRSKKPAVTFSVSIAKGALESIFDDCDKFNVDETGGRILGTYSQSGTHIDVKVLGVLEAGPNAERSPVYFLQDGDYQEKLFRAIEEAHPEIEHLGNWHTHHVNGLQTLSGGDKTTYTKTVNHSKHNTDFFYALLVVKKNAGRNPRYEIKHFFFRRNDNNIYEIPAKDVQLVDAPALQPRRPSQAVEVRDSPGQQGRQDAPNPERAKDQEFFFEFYPGLKALLSKDIGAPYWKGPLSLVDGSRADVVAMENPDDKARSYSIAVSSRNPLIADVLAQYKGRKFPSARHAILHLERDLNQALYTARGG